MRRTINYYDSLAHQMQTILESSKHQEIFKTFQPKIKTAAVKELTAAEEIMNLFLKTSEQLEDLGFGSSSLKTLKAAETFRQELQKLAEDEELEEGEPRTMGFHDPDDRFEIGDEEGPELNDDWLIQEDLNSPHLLNPLVEEAGKIHRTDINPEDLSLDHPDLVSSETDYPEELTMKSLLDDPDAFEDEELTDE